MAVRLASHPTHGFTQPTRAARPCRTRTVALLLLADVLGWCLAGAAAIALAHRLGYALDGRDLAVALLGLAVIPIAYAGHGLYPAAGVSRIDELRRLTMATSGVWLVLSAVVAVLHDVVGIGPLLLTWAVALPAVPIARAVARHASDRRPWYGVPTVMLGAGEAAALVTRRLQRFPNGYRIVAAFDDDPARVGRDLHGVPVVGPLADAARYTAKGVRHALVAMPSLRAEHLADVVRTHAKPFPNVILLPDFAGLASVGVTPRNLGGVVGLHVRQELLRPRNLALKRALDVVMLVPLGLVALPILLLAALAVRFVSPGSPFYAQEREGQGGRTFRMWKLRTMHHDADALLARHLAENPEAAAEWARHFKLRRDPRILPGIGRLLRKTSLDELPQLWNILRGDMSFVGPRPFPAYHLDAFGERFRALRREVRPGLTGLWQVVARAESDLALQEELDTLYIANWSPWMDVYLIARTPWSVLRGNGAY